MKSDWTNYFGAENIMLEVVNETESDNMILRIKTTMKSAKKKE